MSLNPNLVRETVKRWTEIIPAPAAAPTNPTPTTPAPAAAPTKPTPTTPAPVATPPAKTAPVSSPPSPAPVSSPPSATPPASRPSSATRNLRRELLRLPLHHLPSSPLVTDLFDPPLHNSPRKGFRIIMTTSLSSDVPLGYFSWAEYDIMAPVLPKTEDAYAAAFISNCGARNFRLQALERLEQLDVKIDSYGSCHRNHDGQVDKVETLKKYKFSLAFENSNEEDYVTEKFFQSLVAGTVPVVVGAPNIQDFAPSLGSVLHIKELDDADSVAKTMKYLAKDSDAFNKSISWKYVGPSDSFKALMDMAAVHSSCRLCIHLATKIQEKDEKTESFQKRPCRCPCSRGDIYHLYARERGRFEMVSIYLGSWNLTLGALEATVLRKFKSLNHTPIWKNVGPESIRGDELKVHRIYPVGITQRQALYSFKFRNDDDLKKHIEDNLCTKLEVIFV